MLLQLLEFLPVLHYFHHSRLSIQKTRHQCHLVYCRRILFVRCQIILFCNKKKIKLLYQCRTKNKVYEHWHEFKTHEKPPFIKLRTGGKKRKEDLVYELFDEGVKAEISWTNYALKDGIIGMDRKSTENYTKYLANNSLSKIGLKPMYSNIENPYKLLEKQADLDNSSVKANFFEATVTNYSKAESLKGWEF